MVRGTLDLEIEVGMVRGVLHGTTLEPYTRQHGVNICGNETNNVPCSFIVNLEGICEAGVHALCRERATLDRQNFSENS